MRPDESAQGDLFAAARRTDPETSHEAAESIRDLTERQWAVLASLDSHGEMADHVLVEYYGFRVPGVVEQSPQSIRSRRAELVKAGLVEHTGEYVKTYSGRRARVWAVTDKGREALR